MIIKQSDEKKSQITTLQALKRMPGASPEIRKRIDLEIRNIQAGMKGEAEAAYEINFHYGPSKNYAIIHDLRIECEDRVAQIDHLVINRWLNIWVCESKHFSEGIAINAHGECSAFYGGRPYGVPSPFEQNRKHITVLNSAFKSGMANLPTRLGFTIKPILHSVVLISKNARICRPKAKIDGLDCIIKNDQLMSYIDRALDSENNPLSMTRSIGSDTLKNVARSIAALHKPITFNWAAKFGLAEGAPSPPPLPITYPPSLPTQPKTPRISVSSTPLTANFTSVVREESKPKQKLICATCSEPVAYNVARFCWFNKAKYGGNVYCMECQKIV